MSCSSRPSGGTQPSRTISGKSVVAYDPTSGAITTVIADRLEAPMDLAVNANGKVHVNDWADQVCVKVFSAQGLRRHEGCLSGAATAPRRKGDRP
jgi:hypothetical protein